MRISATFIKIFLILSFLVITLNIIGFVFNFYNGYFGYALLAVAFVWLFLIFRKQKVGFWFELPKYVFLLLLLLVTVSSLKFEFMSSFATFFKPYQLFFTIATIAIGALVFWMNRDVVGEIEKEKEDEEKAEKRRYEEFDKRFPFFAWFNFSYGVGRAWKGGRYFSAIGRAIASPVVWFGRLPYVFSRWVYGEGMWYSLTLLAIILVGFILRVWNIGSLNPAGDEFRHLIAAKRYLLEGFFQYPGILSTWIVIIMKKIFNTSSLFLLRLPFVMFGTISIFLFYKIGKLFNKKVGIISAYLFAFCPLAIGLAGYIRNYEPLMFVFILSLFLILRNKELNKKFFLSLLIIIIFLIFINLSDYSEWVQSIDFLLLLVIGTYIFSLLLNKFIKNDSLNMALKIFFSIIGFFLGRYLIPIITHLNLKEELTLQYLFFINYYPTSYLWYLSFLPYLIILLILVLPFLLNIKNSQIYSLSFSLFFFLYTYLFYFTAPRLFQPRYFYFGLPLVIILLSIGVNYLYNLLFRETRVKSKVYWLLALSVIIFLLIFNPFNAVYNTLTIENGESNKNSGFAYFDSQPLVNFLIENNLSEKRILTTQPWVFDYYFNKSFLDDKNKSDYLFYPPTQWFEYFDRSQGYYAINGYWNSDSIKQINWLIKEKDVNLLVFHALPQSNLTEYNITTVSKNYPSFELVKIIDEDKQYGYYILKKSSDEN